MANENALSILAREDIDGWEELRRTTPGSIDLRYAHLSAITLSSFDFSSCDFDGAYFDDCDLRRSDFSHAFLSDAKFRKCMLSGASFYRASISSTEFDRCELDGTNFRESDGLEIEALATSYYDDTTKFPPHIGDPEDWIDEEEDEDLDSPSSDEAPGVQASDNSKSNLYKSKVVSGPSIPEIPDRVLAPLETTWKRDKLYIERIESASALRGQTEDRVVRELRQDLDGLCRFLAETNFDQRIVQDLRENLKKFPLNANDFRRKTISTWYAFRPLFEYMNLTKGQHSDYIEAKIISFELNLRDALLSYKDFRQYEAASQALRTPNQFDYGQFFAAQTEFAKALSKQPESIDQSVVDGVDRLIDIQSRQYAPGDRRSILYGAASTIANIISRIFLRVVREIGDGISEGIKDSTKKLVSNTIAVGGGAVLVWLLTSGLDSFVWLKRAWSFVKSLLSF